MNVPTSTPASLMRPPALVAALGYGGLIPFVGLAGFVMFGPADAMVFARGLLIAYGAVILSFVGALHWGFAMTLPGLDRARKHRSYIWSVIPALMGFLAIAMDSALSLSLLIMGFALAYWQDADLANRVSLPAWYPRLRAWLSTIACVSLVCGLLAPSLV